MATEYSSSIDSDALDDTLLSFPELYIGYVHPALMATLRLIFGVTSYCILGVFKLIAISIRTILWPVYTIGRFFIIPPVSFIYQVCRSLYPIAIFLSVAVICGVIIGGCAGFTAEALSMFFINATWGPPSKTSPTMDDTYEDEEQEEYDDNEDNEDDDLDIFSEDDASYNDDYLDEHTIEDETPSHRNTKKTFGQSSLSVLSSLWNRKLIRDEDDYSEEDDRRSMTDRFSQPTSSFMESTTTALASPTYSKRRIKGKGKHRMYHRHSMASAAYSQNEYRLNQPQMTHLDD